MKYIQDNISSEIEHLKNRNQFLEECNQRNINILDVLASSRDFQEDLNSEKDNVSIFKATFQQLKRLLPFQKMAFYLNTDDNSFDLSECLPTDCYLEMEQEVDRKIREGSFAWALSQNHPHVVPGINEEQSVVLQVIATKSRISGMFIGIMPGSNSIIDAPSQNAMTIILLNTAYALESNRLNNVIRDHVQNLEQKVEERTSELQKSRKIAETANRSKSIFLANMSHELRTPLNAVIGFSDVLLSQSFGPINERQQEYLGYVFQSSRHLLDLINDILDLSKIEANKMELRLTDSNLESLLKNSLIMLKEIAHNRKVQITLNIEPSLPATIRVDERMIKQVMFNLLSNAVKFSPPSGHVSVHAAGEIKLGSLPDKAVCLLSDSANMENSYVEIGITDSGIGILQEDLERIFKPFEQSDNSITREFEGTGLGLTLCREFLALHKGTIWAESNGHGTGSTFRLILPQ
jgi:signal transduction histidine kinase